MILDDVGDEYDDLIASVAAADFDQYDTSTDAGGAYDGGVSDADYCTVML